MANQSVGEKQQPNRTSHYGLATIIDVETTGLDPLRHEILELGILLFAYRRSSGRIINIVDEYVGLREPATQISFQANAVHGITYTMVKGSRLDDDRILALLDKAEFVIAHNVQFDFNFVTRLYPEASRKPWLCSMRQINWAHHGYHSRGLQKLLAAHGIAVKSIHRAGDDCRSALSLLDRRGQHGHTYLQELLVNLPTPQQEVRSRYERRAGLQGDQKRPLDVILRSSSSPAF